MVSFLYNPQGKFLWDAAALLVFAIVFFGVGVFRITEFEGIGLARRTRLSFCVAHIIGCILFSWAVGLLAIDPGKVHRTLMTVIFFSAIVILFPLHIYVGLRRKIRIQDHT